MYGPESFSITGPSFNLNTAQPTTIGVMLANPVLQNPTAAQTITGFNLSIANAQLLLSDGSTGSPAYSWINEPTSGWIRNASNDFIYLIASTSYFRLVTTSAILRAGYPLTWASSAIVSPDTGLSRTAAATVALGNGIQGDASGLLKLSAIGINGANPSAGTINAGTGTTIMASGTTVQTLNNTSAGTQMTIVSYPSSGLTLANGANNDIALTTSSYYRITGPSAGFSVSGFTNGADGRVIRLFNTVAQQMTITNNATSTAANRITTLTGADVVLRAGTSFATFIYDSGTSRWILTATN